MNETKKFYIADWHYDHANCIHFDNRPFKNVDEMNEELIRRWNEAVRPGDLVYILGDMFWCKTTDAIEVLKKLNGQKILVKGNHDRVRDAAFAKCFAKITDYLSLQMHKNPFLPVHWILRSYQPLLHRMQILPHRPAQKSGRKVRYSQHRWHMCRDLQHCRRYRGFLSHGLHQ